MYKDRRDQSSGSKRSAVFPADGTGSQREMPALQQRSASALAADGFGGQESIRARKHRWCTRMGCPMRGKDGGLRFLAYRTA